MLPKTSAYVKSYDGQMDVFFWLKIMNYYENIILSGIKSVLIYKKEFDSEPTYNKGFVKTKIKYHGNEITDFYDKNVLQVDSNYICLAVISLNSALEKDGNYYSQVFLNTKCIYIECKYIEKKVIRHVNDNLSAFSYSDESNEE